MCWAKAQLLSRAPATLNLRWQEKWEWYQSQRKMIIDMIDAQKEYDAKADESLQDLKEVLLELQEALDIQTVQPNGEITSAGWGFILLSVSLASSDCTMIALPRCKCGTAWRPRSGCGTAWRPACKPTPRVGASRPDAEREGAHAALKLSVWIPPWSSFDPSGKSEWRQRTERA